MNKISQKEINDEKITSANWQFTQALEVIRLRGNERSDLQSHFDKLLSIANELNDKL